MIPLGYMTIPEAIMDMEHTFQEGEALPWLEAGLLDGDLQVFTQRGRQYDVEVCRIPWEDVNRLGRNWASWITTGIVPYREPDFPPPTAEQTYSRCQLLLRDTNFSYWFGRLRQQLGLEEVLVAKTGSPGKPSSMHIVIAEFERRRANNRCEGSRTAEAKTLAAWLKEQHPQAPPCEYKAILNKLPPDFQPFNGLPK